jgi:hypothetical protein
MAAVTILLAFSLTAVTKRQLNYFPKASEIWYGDVPTNHAPSSDRKSRLTKTAPAPTFEIIFSDKFEVYRICT